MWTSLCHAWFLFYTPVILCTLWFKVLLSSLYLLPIRGYSDESDPDITTFKHWYNRMRNTCSQPMFSGRLQSPKLAYYVAINLNTNLIPWVATGNTRTLQLYGRTLRPLYNYAMFVWLFVFYKTRSLLYAFGTHWYMPLPRCHLYFIFWQKAKTKH